MLDLVVERVRGLPVLLMVTFRSEFPAPWIGQPKVTMLVLNRLDRHDRTALVAHIAGAAGHNSAARSAMAEAAAQFQKGLDQLTLLPDTPERQRQKLEFSSALGAALRFVKGHSAPETGRAYARARELWEQVGSPREFVHIPFGQSRYHAHRGELDRAQSLAEDLLRLGRRRNETAGLVLGHYSAGRNLMFAGRFALSRSHLEEVLALYHPVSDQSLIHQAGDDPHVTAKAFWGLSFSVSAIRTKPWHRATRQSLRLGD